MPFRREHEWPEGVDPPVPYPVECQREGCGFVLGSNVEPLPLCRADAQGLERSKSLDRGGPLREVSPEREERREARGIYGPLCDHVRGLMCCVPGCRAVSDPAHVQSVGSGHGDFLREDGQWVGNVAPLCRRHHREYDGEVGGGSGEAFEKAHDVDVADAAYVAGRIWMRIRGVDPEGREHPYRQIEGEGGS